MSEETRKAPAKRIPKKAEEAPKQAPKRITPATRKPAAPILEEGHVVVV